MVYFRAMSRNLLGETQKSYGKQCSQQIEWLTCERSVFMGRYNYSGIQFKFVSRTTTKLILC
jgi:hypothetical protein